MNIQSLQEKHLEAVKENSYYTQDDGVLMIDLAAKACTKITLEYCIEKIKSCKIEVPDGLSFSKKSARETFNIAADGLIEVFEKELSELNKQSL